MLTKIQLANLDCPACQKVTQHLIGEIFGVTKVSVSLDTQVAEIEAVKEITKEEVREVLKDTHYKVT